MRQSKIDAYHATFLALCRSQVIDPILCPSSNGSIYIHLEIDGRPYRLTLTEEGQPNEA